jgi:hypothetical protein
LAAAIIIVLLAAVAAFAIRRSTSLGGGERARGDGDERRNTWHTRLLEDLLQDVDGDEGRKKWHMRVLEELLHDVNGDEGSKKWYKRVLEDLLRDDDGYERLKKSLELNYSTSPAAYERLKKLLEDYNGKHQKTFGYTAGLYLILFISDVESMQQKHAGEIIEKLLKGGNTATEELSRARSAFEELRTVYREVEESLEKQVLEKHNKTLIFKNSVIRGDPIKKELAKEMLEKIKQASRRRLENARLKNI